MRQAGRYMPEYRAMRERYGFLELARNPEAAAEVTLQPVTRLGVDAAILFADILLIVEPLCVGLEFARGEGPVIHRPVRSEAAIAQLPRVDVDAAVPFVFETVRRVQRALAGTVPLIGFAGAPFTVASYVVEGGPSRDYLHTKRLMYEEPEGWSRLMGILVDATARYLNGQIAAGAEAVQIFDSWVGVVSPEDWEGFVLEPTRALVAAVRASGVPVIYFPNGATTILDRIAAVGADVYGIDWRLPIDEARARLGGSASVQGNLDPSLLLGPVSVLEKRAADVVRRGGKRGHVFNLGHGITPDVPVENVAALVAAVRGA